MWRNYHTWIEIISKFQKLQYIIPNIHSPCYDSWHLKISLFKAALLNMFVFTVHQMTMFNVKGVACIAKFTEKLVFFYSAVPLTSTPPSSLF